MSLKAIVGATVVDGTGRAPINDAVVLVDGERVRSVAPAAETVLPEQADVIDAAGRYVIPGLMDANVPLLPYTLELVLEYEERLADLIEEQAQVALKSGITTVFNTWGPLEAMTTARDRINRGDVPGCRFFLGGHIIGFTGPLDSDDYRNLLRPETIDRINSKWEQGVGRELVWLTPQEVRRRVRDYIERSDIDHVKYAACEHATPSILFSAETQRAIVEEAHRANLTVQAHTLSPESLRMEIEAGADLLTHGSITGREPMPEETLKIIVNGALPVSAMVCTNRFHTWVQEHGPEWWRTFGFNEITAENNRSLIQAGARLLLTTEGQAVGPRLVNDPVMGPVVNFPVDPYNHLGESHITWLRAVLEQGMAPMEALLSATRYIAEAYGHADELGTLEPDKRADLLVLEADPLADPHNYQRIAHIMKDGALVDRDALPPRRIVTEPDGSAQTRERRD